MDTGGATSLTIWQRDSEDSTIPSPSAYPIFKTLNAAALYDELRLKDVRVGSLDEDEHVRFFTFYDPDGNTLEACEMLDTETKP